jgi:hypothetical protein
MPNWGKEFKRDATQLAGEEFARQWRERGVSARDAARWANLGYTPGEARASGLTIEQAIDKEFKRR